MKKHELIVVIRRAIGMVDEYEKVNEQPLQAWNSSQRLLRVWRAPKLGLYKANVN